MTCEERKDLIGLYAMGSLDREDQEEISAHLQTGCPTCSGYLAEIEAIVDVLPLALNPVAPPPELKARLMKRISDGELSLPVRPAGIGGPPRGWFGRVGDAFIGGAIAAAIGTVAVGFLFDHNRQQIESLRTQVARHDEQLGTLETSIESSGKTLRMLESPSVQVVSAEGTEAQPRALARVFMDRSRGTLLLYTAGLKPLPPDKTYELWLINDQKRAIPSGTFNVNREGEASLERMVPSDAGRIALLAVTAEPAGGVPQPTGAIQLKGAIQ
jgi:anti-sigma-K factor RskA